MGHLIDGGRGQKGPPSLKSVIHILQWWNLIPYLKKIQNLYKSRETPLYFCWRFLPDIRKFCYIKKYRFRFHLGTYFLALLAFLESLRIFLINMVTILMMSAKMAAPGLLKINVLWKSGYDAIIFVRDVNKILSRDSNYSVNEVMWSKFRNSSFSVREAIITSIL